MHSRTNANDDHKSRNELVGHAIKTERNNITWTVVEKKGVERSIPDVISLIEMESRRSVCYRRETIEPLED